MPNFNDFVGKGMDIICHSAKGTTWGSHKYVAKKIINGKVRYIYGSVKNVAENTKEAAKQAANAATTIADNNKKVSEIEEKISSIKLEIVDIDMTRKQYSKKASELLEKIKETRSGVMQNDREAMKEHSNLLNRYNALVKDIKSMDSSKNKKLQELANLNKEKRNIKSHNRFIFNKNDRR